MIHEYQLLDHGSPELLDHYKAGRVVKTSKLEGVLKAHWRDGKNKSHRAWFYKGRRFDHGKQGRTYVDAESGEQFDNLAHITEVK